MPIDYDKLARLLAKDCKGLTVQLAKSTISLHQAVQAYMEQKGMVPKQRIKLPKAKKKS